MNRVLRRPMFRIGGSAGTGITSGLDRKPLKQGTDPEDRTINTNMVEQAIKDTELASDPRVRKLLFPRAGGISPGTLPGFLTSFGLNLASATPTGTGFGGLAATAARAAQQPFQTFQAAKLTREDDEAKFKQDVFLDSLQGQRDIAEALAEGKGTKTFEKDRAADAVKEIYNGKIADINAKIEQLDKNDPDYLDKVDGFNSQKKILEDEKLDNVLAIYESRKTQKEFQQEVINTLLKNLEVSEVAEYFPNLESIMGPGFKIPEAKAEGGRIGYREGTPMMESIVEQEKEQGEVQDLSYTQLRSRLPNEISNEIVMLLANSKQALLDFANIQTTQDIQAFNQQYDVNLTLPQGA